MDLWTLLLSLVTDGSTDPTTAAATTTDTGDRTKMPPV